MGSRRNFNDGQEVLFEDLNAVTSAHEQMLMDRVLPRLLMNQQSQVFGGSFKVSYISSNSVSVAAGVGVFYDAAQTSPEPLNRLLYNESASTQTIDASHPSNNRVDIIAVKATLADEVSASRKFKDSISSVISTVSMVVQKRWELEFSVVKGVEDGLEAVPATPTGYMKICELFVPASTGLTGQDDVTDTRLRFGMNGYAAIVGTGANATHASLAEAIADTLNVSNGDKILVENNETISAGVDINLDDLQIDFKPNVTFNRGGSATEALSINAIGVRINGGRFTNFSTASDAGIRILTTKDYAILFGQRFDNCDSDVIDVSGTATILGNVTE